MIVLVILKRAATVHPDSKKEPYRSGRSFTPELTTEGYRLRADCVRLPMSRCAQGSVNINKTVLESKLPNPRLPVTAG